MTAQEIVRAIVSGTFTAEEVRSFYDAYRFASGQLSQRNTFALRRGQAVKFTGRGGAVITGVVDDVKVKNVIVKVANTRYRVPASMLTTV